MRSLGPYVTFGPFVFNRPPARLLLRPLARFGERGILAWLSDPALEEGSSQFPCVGRFF